MSWILFAKTYTHSVTSLTSHMVNYDARFAMTKIKSSSMWLNAGQLERKLIQELNH